MRHQAAHLLFSALWMFSAVVSNPRKLSLGFFSLVVQQETRGTLTHCQRGKTPDSLLVKSQQRPTTVQLLRRYWDFEPLRRGNSGTLQFTIKPQGGVLVVPLIWFPRGVGISVSCRFPLLFFQSKKLSSTIRNNKCCFSKYWSQEVSWRRWFLCPMTSEPVNWPHWLTYWAASTRNRPFAIFKC